jgi:aldehyde:ferredoxin oxidoreductase
MGQVLWVDLGERKTWVDQPAESIYRDFLGGFGFGARLLYTHQ